MPRLQNLVTNCAKERVTRTMPFHPIRLDHPPTLKRFAAAVSQRSQRISLLLFLLLPTMVPAAVPLAGEPLPGTEQVRIRGESLSLSPDGRWLLMYGGQTSPAEPAILLYSTVRLRSTPVALSSAARQLARQQRGPYLTGGCWSADSSSVDLLGLQGTDLFDLTIDQDTPTLELVDDVLPARRRAVAQCRNVASRPAGLSVRDMSGGGVQVVDRAGTTLAEFKPGWLQSRAAIDGLRLSPGERYLAFVVSRFRGSFVASTTGYILDLSMPDDGLRRTFGRRPIPPLLWGPDGCCIYAFDKADGAGRVYRWDIESLVND